MRSIHRWAGIVALIIGSACSSDASPPPPVTGGQSASDTGDESATTAGPGGEGEGEGEVTTGEEEAGPGSNPTGDPSGNPTTNSGDDTTTGETLTGADDTSSTGQEHDLPPESSSSTGDECPEWGRYDCRGFAAGLFCREGICNAGFGYEFQFGASGQQAVCIEDGGTVSIPICVPFVGEIDSDFLFDECRAECESLTWEWPEEVVIGGITWEFANQTVCVFEPVGNDGWVPQDQEPADMPAGQNIGPADCDFFDDDPQVVYQAPCDNEECQDTSVCSTWDHDVDSKISTSFKAGPPPTYTTKVNTAFWNAFVEERFAELYACDEGRYHESIIGGVSSWAIKDAVAGEFLYELGFRNGDSLVKIAWTGTPGAWTYLDSYEDMAAFYDLHGDKTSFKLEWLRGLVVHKMNLSLN